MLGTLGTHVLVIKGLVSLYDESQFDSQLLQFLQLANAWLVEHCEHNYLKNIIQSCWDHRIHDHSSLLERCPQQTTNGCWSRFAITENSCSRKYWKLYLKKQTNNRKRPPKNCQKQNQNKSKQLRIKNLTNLLNTQHDSGSSCCSPIRSYLFPNQPELKKRSRRRTEPKFLNKWYWWWVFLPIC